MPLTTYSTLKASIREWSHRNDLSNAQIDEFILLAEQAMWANDEEPLSIRDEEVRARAVTSTTEKYLALPDRFLSMRSFHILRDNQVDSDVQYMAPEHLFSYSDAGMPKHFTITSQIQLDRVSDQAYDVEMNYIATIAGLSDSNATNTVLSNHASIYLFGTRWALEHWKTEETKAQLYWAEFIRAIKGANKQTQKGRYGPAPIMRIEGSTP